MITQDRIELNGRFRKVFEMLEEKGIVKKNSRDGKGMGDFAYKVLGRKGYGHIIRAFLNPDDKRVISYHQARNVCREYDVNEAYLIDGIGTPFGFEFPKYHPQPEDTQYRGNILFTTTEAFAGETIGTENYEEQIFYSVPGLEGDKLYSFPINGNSMEPIIMNGDIVICRQIESLSQLKDNKIYAVKDNGKLWVKYVQPINESGKAPKLKLISANHFEYDPFEIDLNTNTQLFRVIRKISEFS